MNNTDEMDRDIGRALDALDYPVRQVSAESIIQEARSRVRQRRWRFAAAAAVMLSAVAVAALPGSPVRRWIASALGETTAQQIDRQAPQQEGLRNNAEMRGVSTVVGASPEISFSDWQDSGEIVLRLIPGSEMRIRSPEFPSSYSLRAGNITVRNPGSRASYDVEVSERASSITVIVGGQVVFRRQNGAVVVGPLARADSAYVLRLQKVKNR